MKFNNIPQDLQNEKIDYYRDILKKKKFTLFVKRVFDIIVSLILIILLLPIMFIISILIKLSSKGPILYKQKRVTKNLQIFNIYKFRTMVVNADKVGSMITIFDDPRVTSIGRFLRKYRLDEFPQLFNILIGDMSFVGPRPEVVKYVEHYTDEMYATLLIRAGITSPASIKYKDEAKLLESVEDVDEVYINKILPHKMIYNYQYLINMNLFTDLWILIRTIF